MSRFSVDPVPEEVTLMPAKKKPGARQVLPRYADLPELKPLTRRQERFVVEFLRTLNGARAARLAGYSPKRARQQAHDNVSKRYIKLRIEARLRDTLEKVDLQTADTLLAIQRMVRQDIRDLFDEDGNHLPVHVLDAKTAAQIAGVEYVTKNVDASDGHTDRIYRLKLKEQAKFVELAAKYQGLLVEKLEVSGDEEFIAELQAARKRANLALQAAKDVTPVKRKRLTGKGTDGE